jgi:hypothetical protein
MGRIPEAGKIGLGAGLRHIFGPMLEQLIPAWKEY